MTCSDLDQLRTENPDVRKALLAGDTADAVRIANQRLATSLSDLASAQFAAGENDETAFDNLRNAVNIAPGSQLAFHDLTAALLGRRLLRGTNLQSLQGHLIRNVKQYPWMKNYRVLLYLPRWLNLEFVLGKCNLKCRMCLGTQSPSYPNKLDYLTADDFERMLLAAPTVAGVTLSSGDSDPLLHPEIDRVIEIATANDIGMSIFTNGLPLGTRTCRKIVESQTITMINFSIDAATQETYERIRGDRLDRVFKKIEMLQDMKAGGDHKFPAVSMSFVAMADNIAELPEFVRIARRLGAMRVYVEDVIGWENGENGNHLSTDNPDCAEFVREAREAVGDTEMTLTLPERLKNIAAGPRSQAPAPDARDPRPTQTSEIVRAEGPVSAIDPAIAVQRVGDPLPGVQPTDAAAVTPPASESKPASPNQHLACCSWIDGVYVNKTGRLDPCCLVHNVADMGGIHDGPLFKNEKYKRVKDLLLTGMVFPRCEGQRMCIYVQQQAAAGRPLEFITPALLGDAALAGRSAPEDDLVNDSAAKDNANSRVSLDVLPMA